MIVVEGTPNIENEYLVKRTVALFPLMAVKYGDFAHGFAFIRMAGIVGGSVGSACINNFTLLCKCKTFR